MAGGPVTRNTAAVSLGLAQVRIGASLANIASTGVVLTDDDSIGSLATTKWNSAIEIWKHESGFPLKEDVSIPIREAAAMEVSFEEITPYNMALARGLDPASYSKTAFSGEIGLGSLSSPEFIRMEAIYTYPNGVNTMNIVFPRAQVTSSPELDLQKEDNAKPVITIEAKQASSSISGGNAAWDAMPLGRIYWA